MGDRDLAKVLNRQEVTQIVSEDLGTTDFNLLSYKLSPFSENPMGFLGIHIKISVTFEISGKTTDRNYFAKKIPEDIPSHNAYAKGTGAFYKEIEFYQAVVNDIKKNTAPDRKLTKWCPDFYFARGTDILVVEDLCDKGYYMYPERVELDLDHIKATVRAMAAMHAGPMILAQKLADGKLKHLPNSWKLGKPTTLAAMYPQMVYESEVSGDPKHPGNKFYEAGFKSQVAIVDLLPGYTSEQRANIKEKLPDILRRIFLFVEPSEKYRNSWVHGDLWANNTMFRADQQNKVQEAAIIDFQLARLAPPGHDVVMFMHQVQSREFLAKHESEIIDAYYEAFERETTAEGYEVEAILPKSEFVESLDFYYEFALLSQVMFFQLTLAPSHITSQFLSSPDLFTLNMLTDRTEMVVYTFKNDELSRTRITEAMNELIRFYKLAD